jgi:hypothetical protein
MIPAIDYTAPPSVLDAVAGLGRTEDLCFSPSNRRLAVAAFLRNRIAIFDVDIVPSPEGARVALTGGLELTSPALDLPHGVDFIDDDTLIVTNRGDGVAIFAVPPGEPAVPTHQVVPLAQWPAQGAVPLKAPGSVSVVRLADHLCDVLICDNAAHRVTRHRVDRRHGGVASDESVLLAKYLDLPDGVTMSHDRRWVAVSNHNTHNVLLYENRPSLNAEAEPDGILRRVYYPHALRFSRDDRHLFVADAGAPYVHVYAQEPGEWRGVRHPVATGRIMDDTVFEKGRHNPREGGPKGLALDASFNVLAVTAECLPLAFFDPSTLLRCAHEGASTHEHSLLDLRYELTVMERSSQMAATAATATAAHAVIDEMQNSTSWRITAPLRRLGAALRRPT